MRILITGSRDWDNAKSINHRILEAIEEWIAAHPGLRKDQGLGWVTIVHGGHKAGADRIADIFSRKYLGKEAEVHEARWKKYGRRAGPLRNLKMVETFPDVCLAFIKDNSSGATGCRDLAKKKGIATESFYYENEIEEFPLPKVDKN